MARTTQKDCDTICSPQTTILQTVPPALCNRMQETATSRKKFRLRISARITSALRVKFSNHLFHWTDFSAAHLLHRDKPKNRHGGIWLPARRSTLRSLRDVRYLRGELWQRSLCKYIRLDLWKPRTMPCSPSAAPEKLFCTYFDSSFGSYCRYCRRPPATGVSASGAHQFPAGCHLSPPRSWLLT